MLRLQKITEAVIAHTESMIAHVEAITGHATSHTHPFKPTANVPEKGEPFLTKRFSLSVISLQCLSF